MNRLIDIPGTAARRASVPVALGTGDLTLAEIAAVADHNSSTVLDPTAPTRMQASVDSLEATLAAGRKVYGVNTLFGGLADRAVPAAEAQQLQQHLIESHNAGVGPDLEREDVRAAMAIRVNALARGASAIRSSVTQRYVDLLNLDVTPRVRALGSIGASGDLVPLAQIAGAACGLSKAFELHYGGSLHPAPNLLKSFDLAPIELGPKEGLALINGTAALTGIAARNVSEARRLTNLNLALHGLIAEVLRTDLRAFASFVQQIKPHPGQILVGDYLRTHLDGSGMTRDVAAVEADFAADSLVQDRYSIRCLPQFLGPIVEDLARSARQVEVEINAVTDNPLVDASTGAFFHGGNFLGQHVAMAMDRMRLGIALCAKHADAQIMLLVDPAFSHGLTPSLMDPDADVAQVGLKPLQIVANSIAPLIEHRAAALTLRFPTHAEQCNQNVNSQGFSSALETRESLRLWRHHLAVTAIFAVQAALVRCRLDGLDWQRDLAPTSARLVGTVREALDARATTLLANGSSNASFAVWVEKIEHAIETGALASQDTPLDPGFAGLE